MQYLVDEKSNSNFRCIHKLHAMGQLEGLLLVMNPLFSKVHVYCRKERALDMLKYKPKTFEISILGKKRDPTIYTDYIKGTLKLTETAQEFCSNRDNISREAKFAPTKIIVKNISFKVKQKEFWTFFEQYGKVLRATIVTQRRSRRSKGYGFVVFTSPLAAEKALKTRRWDLVLRGRQMVASPACRNRGSKKVSMYSAKTSLKQAITQYVNTEYNNENEEYPEVSDGDTDNNENAEIHKDTEITNSDIKNDERKLH